MIKHLYSDILIVEDEPNIIELLEEYCSEMGLFRHVITARDGQMASAKLANQNFKIILLDINIPKKSGIEIISDLKRKKLPTDHIIVISGELDSAILKEAMANGVKHYIVKPFKEEDLIEKINLVLKNK